MNKFISKKILPSLLTAILSFSCFSCTFALKTNHKEDISSGKTATESFGSKVSKRIKKIISNPKFYVPATIIGALSTPSIYSNIKYSKPRDITNIQGETDEEIGRYGPFDYKLEDATAYMTEDTKNRLENKVNEILEQMHSADCDTNLKKAIYLHNYICSHCSFDVGEAVDFFTRTHRFGGENCRNATGCLTEHKAVCVGISKTYALLLNKVGIECKCMDGVSYGMNHTWNIVKIDGAWRQVDLTWDLLFKALHGKYRWFMLSKEEMGWDHKPYVSQIT